MAIAKTSISTAIITTSWDGSGWSGTESVTTSGTPDYLLVMIGSNSHISAPTTVEFNSTALTQQATINDGNSRSVHIYTLASPGNATADIEITNATTGRDFQLVAFTLTGVDSIRGTATDSGWLTNASTDITTVSGDMVFDILQSANSTTVGSGQTEELAYANGKSASSESATTTTTTMSWTHTGGWGAHALIAFVEAASSATLDSSDASVRAGASASHTVSGFGSTINDVHITDATYEIEATSENDTSATFPAMSHGAVMAQFGTGRTYSVSDGTDSDTATIEWLPDTGFTHTAVTAIAASPDADDWSYGLSNVSNTDVLITRDADSSFVTHNADGTSSATGTGTSLVYVWDNTDGALTSVTLVYGPSGPAVADRVNNLTLGAWLYDQGYTGTFNDMMMAWLAAEGHAGNMHDMLYKYLGAAGYSGTLADRLRKWQNGS